MTELSQVDRTKYSKLPNPREYVLSRVRKTAVVITALSQSRESSLGKINRSHGFRGLARMEGFMPADQAEFFDKLIKGRSEIRQIAEIGFNGGHSSFVFLGASDRTEVTSFDIGQHEYVEKAVRCVNTNFPNRHKFIKGDSTITVPEFAELNPQSGFDLIFIDGGHDYQTAGADITNMRQLAKPNCLVVVDDYLPNRPFGVGPTQAWDEAVRNRIVVQDAIFSGRDRTWAVGRYLKTA